MATSKLMLHCGARLVNRDELDAIPAPSPEGRWFPIAHSRVLDTVLGTLDGAGFKVQRQQLALNKQGTRFFGTLDLTAAVSSGVTLAVGIRNSIDRTFPLGFCAGSRVFLCDNLAFRAELLVKKKHTRFGEVRFNAAILQAVTSLNQFKEVEGQRIEALRVRQLAPEHADSLILRSFERGIISAPQLPCVLHEWRHPSHEEFAPRTAWSLLNAYTTVLADRHRTNPQAFSLQTIRLQQLFDSQPALAVAG